VEKTPKTTNFAIVMETTRELVGELLIDPEGAPARKFDLEELVPILDKCKYMSSPSIKNKFTHVQVYMQIWGHGLHCHTQRL
jgi:hypothetical protein